MKNLSSLRNLFTSCPGMWIPVRLSFVLVLLPVCAAETEEEYVYRDYKVKPYELPETTDDARLEHFEVFSYEDEETNTTVQLPSLVYIARDAEKSAGAPRGISASVSKRFTIVRAPEGRLISRPHVTHLGDGELVMRISPDPDYADEEEFMLSSADGGKTWEEVDGWPMSDGAGRHFFHQHTRLPDGSSMVVATYMFNTGKKDEYIIASWVSDKDGKSNFKQHDSEPFHFPFGATVDWWDPVKWPVQMRGGPRNFMPDFLTGERHPSEHMKNFQAKYGKNWLAGHILPLYALDDETVLAFVTSSPDPSYTPRRFESTLTCLQSKDRGRTWTVRSVPGPWDPALEDTNKINKTLDGFCEPTITRLPNGDHLIIMRIGAWQRLYSAVSKDECLTWSKPQPISVFGILPEVEVLPDGVLALSSGRPDNTLSFSFDNGKTWPWTLRILDQTLPEHPSTRNSTMKQVAPGRLLYVYDYGYRRPDEGVDVPHAVEGVFIDVTSIK